MILANSKYEIRRCDHVIISNLFKHTFMIVSIVDSLKMQVQVVVSDKEKTPLLEVPSLNFA